MKFNISMCPRNVGLIVFTMLFSTLCIFLFAVHRHAEQVVLEDAKITLLDTSKRLLTMISAEDHNSLTPGKNEELYNRLASLLLRSISNTPDIATIYTFRKDGKKVIFVLLPVVEEHEDSSGPLSNFTSEALGVFPYGEYENTNAYAMKALIDGKTVVSDIYTDQWGTFISVFTPIISSSSSTPVGVLGADISETTLIEKMETTNSMIRYSVVIAFFISIILGFLVAILKAMIDSIDASREISARKLKRLIG